jgi:hypothetical protein
MWSTVGESSQGMRVSTPMNIEFLINLAMVVGMSAYLCWQLNAEAPSVQEFGILFLAGLGALALGLLHILFGDPDVRLDRFVHLLALQKVEVGPGGVVPFGYGLLLTSIWRFVEFCRDKDR